MNSYCQYYVIHFLMISGIKGLAEAWALHTLTNFPLLAVLLCHLPLKISLCCVWSSNEMFMTEFVWLYVVKLISTDKTLNDFLKGSYAHFCPLVLRWSDPFWWLGSGMNMMIHGLPTWIYLNISLMSAGYQLLFIY